jgi:dTDP-glucose pyrophosphorylase
MGFIDRSRVLRLAKSLEKSGYGKYLMELFGPG